MRSSRVHGVDVLLNSLAELIDQVTHVVQQVLNPSVNLRGEREGFALNLCQFWHGFTLKKNNPQSWKSELSIKSIII